MTKPLSAEKYIQTRARTLPIDRCLVNANWKTTRIAHVTVIRNHTNGNSTYAAYLVDLLCLGVKDTYYNFNQFPDELDDFLDDPDQETDMVEIEYSLAHNIIFAGHDFASDYHIPQHPDFVKTTRYLLEEDDDKIPLIDVQTGDENGLPHLVVTSSNTQPIALARLKQYAGEGNYRYTIIAESPQDEFPGDLTDDDDDDDEDFDDDLDDLDEDDDDAWDEDEEDLDFISWTQQEWNTYIIEMSPDNFSPDGAAIAYIHLKAITVPDLTNRGMDIQEMSEKAMQGVDWEQARTEDRWQYSQEEKDELEQLYNQVFQGDNSRSELRKIVENLRKGIARWPHNPIYRNYLYNAYILLGEQRAAEKEMRETVNLFPDYLMAKIVYAGWLMKNHRIADVPGLLNNSRSLADLYKDRRDFHVNEFMHFNSVWLHYYLFTEDFYLADFYGSLLECLPIGNLWDQQNDLLQMLMISRAANVMKLLAKVRNNPTELHRLTTLLAADDPKLSVLFGWSPLN